MGLPTIDQKNPGQRQVQRYKVSGGLSFNNADHEVSPVDFLLLKNCLVDKRTGALLKRPGSTTESAGSSLGLPLGMGEYVEAASGAMPIKRTLLTNFGGSSFKKKSGNTWSSITPSGRCSFSNSRQNQFTKLGQNMFIAGGRPALWGGGNNIIDRVGIIPPTSPITITSYNTGSGITLTEGTSYVYTYYQSWNGLESDWSEPSAAVPAISNKSIVIGIPSATAGNWDQIKIYRYFDGGAFPYLVDTVPSGTTSYTDSTPDEDLTERIADRYDHGLPPDESFIVAKYAQCIWWVDANNPYKIVFSKPFTGSNPDLEYYPIDNVVYTNEPITGFLLVPGKLLVIHPRNISYISGTSVDDFVLQPFLPGVGTVFANSVSANGQYICMLGEQGFIAQPIAGGPAIHISREIDLELQPLLSGSYNAAFYVSSAWNPALRQFIFMVNAQSTAGAPWRDSSTGAIATWRNTVSLVTDTWQDSSGASSTASMRIKIWGWSPELSTPERKSWHEYTFPTIADNNVAGAYPTFLFHPQPSNDTLDPQQDKTYLGYWDGSEGKVRSCFRRDKNQDDSTNITSEWITCRLQPGDQSGGYKLFEKIGFTNSYSDPTSDSNTTLKYLIDFDDPQIRSYSGSLITITGSRDLKNLTTTLGRHIHLYGIDTSQSQSKILLSEFFLHYREKSIRGGR